MAELPPRGETPVEEDAVKANELLLWLSARREGSWRQYRAAVEELCGDDSLTESNGTTEVREFPLHLRLKLDFERLAHVEFFVNGCEGGWRVTPPAVASRRANGEWLGVLCGARSDGLLLRIPGATESVRLDVRPGLGIPDVIRVLAHREDDVRRFAESVGALFQSDAPLAMLQQLPVVAAPPSGSPEAELPLGASWRAEQFLIDQLRWVTVDRREAEAMTTGLLRFKIFFEPPRHFLRWNGRTHKLPRAVGLYALLRRRRKQVIRYNSAARTLTVPAICRPPLLVERALVLCSGLPPEFSTVDSRLTYSELPGDIASITAQVLHQNLA